MTNGKNMEVDSYKLSWFRSLFRWCPTSFQLLREAEKYILRNLKCTYRGQYVNVGKTVGSDDSHVWTIIANEQSDKTPIVLIHGFASGVGFWCLNIDSLASQRPVYAFDIIGFGRSSRPTFDSDALEAEAEFINTIESWRSKIGLEKFILLGHSFGGFLAASYSIKHPERISHLILADPWGFPEKPLDVGNKFSLPLWIRTIGFMIRPFNPLFIIRTAGPFGPKLIERARPDLVAKFEGVVEDAASHIPNYLYHCNAQTPSGESAFHTVMSGFGWAKYPMIHRMDSLRKEVPITLIYGARSWIDRDPGFELKYMRPSSYVDVQIIPSAGHHVYADRARMFNDLVNRIGEYVDKGELPPTSSIAAATTDGGSEQNGGASLSKFLYVNRDRIRDDDEAETNAA